MADILVTCEQCGAETAVSEYVDPALATCRACGEKLNVPYAEMNAPRPPPQHQQEKPQTGPNPLERSTVAAANVAKARRSRVRKRKRVISWSPSVFTIWIIFVVGTLLLCLLRYWLFQESDRKVLIHGGLVCMFVLHMTVVVDAFAEDILTGVLCLIVPGYSLFYLFTMCDSYILRLGVGVLMIPFGMDAVKLCYESVDAFIKWMGKAGADSFGG